MADDDYEEYEEDADDVDALKAAEEATAKEAERLQKAPAETSQQENSTTSNAEGYDKDAQKEVDARSIYVGNVEYTVDSAELAEFFASCGTVQRVTIPGDRTQHPKGYAYVEFLEPEAVENALKLEGSEVGSRPIKVARKRTNEAGAVRGRGGRFGRGRGRGRGRAFGMMPMPMMFDPSMMMGGYSPYGGGRGNFRGRGRGGRAGGRRQSTGE